MKQPLSSILGKMDRVQLLKAKLANIDVKHDQTIMKEETLKGAHTYCVIHGLSAQQYGPLLEKYIIAKFGFKKNTASSCIGDCVKGGVNVEIKASLGGAKHNKFNYVQIRPSHNVEYICTAYSLTEECRTGRRDICISYFKGGDEDSYCIAWIVCPWNKKGTWGYYTGRFE